MEKSEIYFRITIIFGVLLVISLVILPDIADIENAILSAKLKASTLPFLLLFFMGLFGVLSAITKDNGE